MNKQHPSQRNHTGGFTLQEIIVAFIIVGVLAGLVVPRFGDSMRRVTNQEGEGLLIAMFDAQKEYEYERGAYTNDESRLDVEFNAPKHFNPPQAINRMEDCGGAAASIRMVGSILRADAPPYTLFATEEGQIVCCPGIAGNDVCERLGYDFPW